MLRPVHRPSLVLPLVLVLALFALPAGAADGVASASSDSATPFLDTQPGDDLAWLTGCSAEYDCGDGNTVSCTGNTSCYVGYGSVTCDGNQTFCPNYCTVQTPCWCPCPARPTIQCSHPSGNCSVNPNTSVSCPPISVTCTQACQIACSPF